MITVFLGGGGGFLHEDWCVKYVHMYVNGNTGDFVIHLFSQYNPTATSI